MKISETFHSIQGEGTLLGVPSFFIRTTGCNLRCSWCDTPYTSWEPQGEDRTIADLVREAAGSGARHVVVTGGEPMIASEIVPLTQALRAAGLHITIETAGTVDAPVACDLMSISPKLANSTPQGRFAAQHERLRIQPAVLRRLMDEYDYQLKFVVAAPEDLTEIDSLVASLAAPAEKVLLMPEGITRESLRERGPWLAEICKQKGYRFSPRLHIEIWGNRRGT